MSERSGEPSSALAFRHVRNTHEGSVKELGEDRLRELLEDFRDRFAVPAIGGAVVSRSGALDVQAIGTRRRGSSDPVSIEDQWHIGSCAKAMTAVLYAKLVERGDAEWGVPVSSFFSDVADQFDARWSVPTVDEVLVGRSGMRANLSLAERLRFYTDTSPLPDQRTQAVVSALSRAPRNHGAFRYSNLGYIVVGAAIDRIAGVPFEDALRTHLFEPLGIASAGFGAPPDIWGHKTRLLGLARGAPVDPAHPYSDNAAVMTPAGRIHLSLFDWAKFQRLFLNQGLGLLKAETIEHLLALPPNVESGMAMGWVVEDELPGVSYSMEGSNTYSLATVLVDADFERAAMVVTNDARASVRRRSKALAASILEFD